MDKVQKLVFFNRALTKRISETILLTVCVRISLEHKYKIIEVGKIIVRTSETKRIVVLKRMHQIEQ